jgi:hypothetical protein
VLRKKWLGRRGPELSTTTPKHQYCAVGRAEGRGYAKAAGPPRLRVRIPWEHLKYARIQKFSQAVPEVREVKIEGQISGGGHQKPYAYTASPMGAVEDILVYGEIGAQSYEDARCS